MPRTQPESPGAFLDYRHGILCLEGVPLDALAARFGTPFFLLSEARLIANYRALERGLPFFAPPERSPSPAGYLSRPEIGRCA